MPYMLYLLNTKNFSLLDMSRTTTTLREHTLIELEELLHEYKPLFNSPKGFPPSRLPDH